jgi:uncharacterized protein with HEPN domain
MERDPRGFLWDARHSADTILRFVAGVTEEEYLANELLQAAVERHFVIIGEALGRLAKVSPELTARIPDLQRAITFRNVLVHGYEIVRPQTVWLIIQEDLPVLRESVEAALNR